MNKNKIILTDALINEPSHYHTKIDQTFLKEGLLRIRNDFEFLDLHTHTDIGTYLNKFIDNETEEVLETGLSFETVDTDIAAIVIPLSHGDCNAIWHVAYNGNIKGFSKYAMEEYAQIEFNKSLTNIQKSRQIQELFMETFRIPVFESYKFLPGYRYENEPLGRDIPFEEMMPIVKAAYDVWLNKNFSGR